MARSEDFRKVSTTLFHHRAGDAGDWSGVLSDHKNLINHQLYFTASAPVDTGSFELRIVPDTEADLSTTVGTGIEIAFGSPIFGNSKDSDFLSFTGVISGLHLRSMGVFDPDITISAVLTSYSHNRQRGVGEERYDYVSSTIFQNKKSQDIGDVSLPTPNHLNMAYHQMMIVSDSDVDAGEFEIRVVPDSEEELETTVYVSRNLYFPLSWTPVDGPTGGDQRSFILWFGGVFKGIHLKQVIPFSYGHQLTAVLSSSVERFDQVLFNSISTGLPSSGHYTDYDNPHQTSWDNLLNKPTIGITDWPVIKDYIDTAESYIIPEDFQMLVWDAFDVQGAMTVEGTMVVLGDHPDELVPIDPDFTYDVSDVLTQIDYAGGEQKVFTYNGSGDLERLDFIRDGVTYRKDFFYTVGGDLDYVDEYYV